MLPFSIPSLAYSQLSITTQLDARTIVSLELDYMQENKNHIYGSFGRIDIGIVDLQNIELGWYKPISENNKHNLGASVNNLKLNKFLGYSFSHGIWGVSTKYSFHFNGSDKSGFKVDLGGMFFEGANKVIPFYNLGYKFNF